MKKVLFIAMSFSFYVASAQQNPFLIPKKPIFKKNLSFDYRNRKIDSLIAQRRISNHFTTYTPPQAKFSHTLLDSTKVYLLPLDNMVCLVPDMSQFNMPNEAIPDLQLRDFLKTHPPLYKKLPGQIPNGTRPYDIIPQRKDTPTQ